MAVGRNFFGTKHRDRDEFEEMVESPNSVLDEQKKAMLPMALAIEETVQTKGWKDIIEPFLKKHGNPKILFEIIKKKTANADYMAGKIEAYSNFLTLITNLLSLLPKDEEKK